jgi:hypothetical protein
MRWRTFRTVASRGVATLASLGLLLVLPGLGRAQTASNSPSAMTEAPSGESEEGLPATSIAPADEVAPAPVVSHRHAATTASHHTADAPAAPTKFQIEQAQAKLRLKKDTPIYEQPNVQSKHLEQGQAGKIIVVTGATQHYLRVKLKSGRSGYVPAGAAELVAPTDKVFTLTHNASVLDSPNRWGKRVSEVHQGHAVHVVGVALNYMKIKMRSGLEGFIPTTALE